MADTFDPPGTEKLTPIRTIPLTFKADTVGAQETGAFESSDPAVIEVLNTTAQTYDPNKTIETDIKTKIAGTATITVKKADGSLKHQETYTVLAAVFDPPSTEPLPPRTTIPLTFTADIIALGETGTFTSSNPNVIAINDGTPQTYDAENTIRTTMTATGAGTAVIRVLKANGDIKYQETFRAADAVFDPPSTYTLVADIQTPITIIAASVDPGETARFVSSNTSVLQVKFREPQAYDVDGKAHNQLLGSHAGTATLSVYKPDGSLKHEETYTVADFTMLPLQSATTEAQATFGEEVDPTVPGTTVTLTTMLTNRVGGRPAANVPVTVNTAGASVEFFDAQGHHLPPYRGGFKAVSDGTGKVTIVIGATQAGIHDVIVGPASGNKNVDLTVVFLDDTIAGDLSPLDLPINLDLNGYPDYIPLGAPPSLLGMVNNNSALPVVIVVDGKVVLKDIDVEELINGRVALSKSQLQPGDHTIYYMVYDPGKDIESQSPQQPLSVTGDAIDNDPTKNGTLARPYLMVNTVTPQNIFPSLNVYIPEYAGMAAGDVINLQFWINAWDDGGQAKPGGRPLPGIATVTAQMVGQGPFTVPIGYGDLQGFDRNPENGEWGTFQAQYSVLKGSQPLIYSLPSRKYLLDTWGFGDT